MNNMNISKEDFVNTINKLKRCIDKEDNIDDILQKFDIYLDDDSEKLYDTVIHLLEILTGVIVDEEFGSDISYFCWDLDFGRDYEPGMITDKEGNDIDFSTAESLYDYLTSI